MSPEGLAHGIEEYVRSLQVEAETAEILYLSGQPEIAEEILRSMEKRMGIF